MQLYLYAILLGCGISLSGSLPLGNLNISAMYIAGKETVQKAFLFSLGVVFVELIYLSVTIAAISWVSMHVTFFSVLQWLAVVFLLLLSLGSIKAAVAKNNNAKNVVIDNRLNRFALGAGMSAVNPMQFPFWAGWVTWLVFNRYINTSSIDYVFFVSGVGLGTMMALSIFIFFGKYYSRRLNENTKIVHIVMAVLFMAMALFQTYQLLK